MTTAIAVRKPTTMTKPQSVKLNADGKAIDGYETIDIPLPSETQASARVCVGHFPRRGDDLPGWRATATITRINEMAQTGACRERWHAIVDAVEFLTNRLVDIFDRARGRQRQWLKTVITRLNAWNEAFEKQAKKEATEMVTARTKMLDSKQCRALLADFRRCYEACMHSFVELGDKADMIRQQEAYGESCETFDQWIKSEGYGHTFVYDCMKAARLYRLMAPTLQPRQITLDCESHYRDIPADVTPKEAKAIATELVKAVSDAGCTKVTRQQVKAAVQKLRPKPAAPPPPPKPLIETLGMDSAVAEETPAETVKTPRVAPETITGEYCDVATETNDDFAIIQTLADQIDAAINTHLGLGERMISFRCSLASMLDQKRRRLASIPSLPPATKTGRRAK